MSDALSGRIVCIWRAHDPCEDVCNLADAAAATRELFDRAGELVWLNGEGRLIPASGPVVREVIKRRVVVPQIVNRDGRLVLEYIAFVVNDGFLKLLLTAERRQDGSLISRVPPVTPGRGCS